MNRPRAPHPVAFLRVTPAVVALALASGPTQPASAAMAQTYFNLRISASACDVSGPDRAKLQLVHGSWEFSTTGSGTVILFCPLQLAWVGNVPTFSKYVAQMRVWYRDPSGTGTASSVAATLEHRGHTGGPVAVGTTFQSNSWPMTTDDRVWHTINQTVQLDAGVTHVRVTLYRATTGTTTPRLTGIDFWSPPTFTP